MKGGVEKQILVLKTARQLLIRDGLLKLSLGSAIGGGLFFFQPHIQSPMIGIVVVSVPVILSLSGVFSLVDASELTKQTWKKMSEDDEDDTKKNKD